MTSKEIRDRLNQISTNVNEELAGFYSKLKKSVNKAKNKQKVNDSSVVVDRPIGVADISGQVPQMTPSQREEAMSVVKDITQEIQKKRAEYGYVDLGDRGADRGSKGSGEGTGEVELLYISRPDWFDELEKGIGNRFKRTKKREYFDIEGLYRGATRKRKDKGLKRKNYVYLLLDVSGSMGMYSYKGTPLVVLFASYLPPLVRKYDGSFIEVDGGEIKDTPFKALSRLDMENKIELSGGGGAEFDVAIPYVIKHIKDNEITDPVVIIATDSNENFNTTMPKNTFFMTTKYGVEHWSWNGLTAQGFPNTDLGQKGIIIDID